MINNIENTKSKNKKEEEKNSDLNQNITSNSNYNKNNFLTSPIIKEKNIEFSENFLNKNENEEIFLSIFI